MTSVNEITNARLSTKPSETYGQRFELIKNREPVPGCKCSWRDRALGDGCEFCNPELADEIRRENADTD